MRRTGNKLTWVIATMAAGLLVLVGAAGAAFIGRG